MVLVDSRRPIIHLSMSTDGSLRLASVYDNGVVKLWDIWDEGNMYVTLTSPESECIISTSKDLDCFSISNSNFVYNHVVVVTAWHPFISHIFLGDLHGCGLVLQVRL